MVSFGSVRRPTQPWDTPPIWSDPNDPVLGGSTPTQGGMFGAIQTALGSGAATTGGNDSGILSQALTAAPVQPSPVASQRPTAMGRGMFGGGMTIDQGPQATAPVATVLGDVDPQVKADWAGMTQPGFNAADIQVRRPGFFQQGGLGGKILHGLGEVALQYQASHGDQGALLTLRNRLEQQAAHRRAIEQVKQRQTEREEWLWRKNFDLGHPDDQFTRYMTQAGIDPRSPQGQAMYRQRAETMATPPTVAVDGFDAQGNPTKTFMPRAGFNNGGRGGSAPSGPAPGTVKNGYRFQGGNPNDRNSWVPAGGASSNGDATFPTVMDAVIGQESGGRAGVTGPKTRYGQAQGVAQLLPATAQAMAAKIGVPWRPDLMTATHQAAADYQRALGEAYLKEGIAATGSIRDGLRYYHGGPSRKQWGPKTNAYADAVLARMGA